MKTRFFAALALTLGSAAFAACSNSSDDVIDDSGVDTGQKMDATMKVDTGVDTGTQMDTGTDTGTMSEGGGMDGGADAGPGFNFMVVRVGGTSGDGGVDSGALTNASAPVFLEERRSQDGMLLRIIPMPTMANGNNQPLTIAGNAPTEGTLTRSDDGKCVVMFGYGSAPGVASISGTASNATNRIVGKVDSMGTIDTSTKLDTAYNTASVRGAASKDCTAFWTAGAAGSQTSGGVWYATLGQTGGTQIFTTVTNMREVGVYGAQLYGSTQSGNAFRLFSIGTGTPTTANQTGTELPGITTMNTAPHGFVILDLNNQVMGVDTAYVADDAATNMGGGVQKWTFDGMNWTLKATFNDGLTAGVSNVAADIAGPLVHVVAVTAENPSRVVRYVDDNQNLMPMVSALTTAQPNTQFRGIAPSPK